MILACMGALALCPPAVFAQQPGPLTIWTRDADIAERCWQLLPHGDDAPVIEFAAAELSASAVHRLMLDDVGDVTHEVVETDDPAEYRVELDPRALLGMYESEVKRLRLQTRGLIGATYSAIGLTYEDAAMVVDGLFDFPSQLARVELRVMRVGDPGSAGWHIECRLVPVADSTTARVHAALAPAARTMPSLTFDDRLLSADVCVDWPALFAVLEPHLEPLAKLWTRSKGERETAMRLFAASMRAFDGGMHMSMRRADSELYVITGLGDAAAFDALCDDPDYLAQTLRAAAAGGQATPTFERAALRHRDIVLDRLSTVIENPAFVNPFMNGGGEFVTLRGLVEDRLLSISGKAPDYAAVIDTLLDGQAAGREFPAHTHFMLEMRLDDWFQSVAGALLAESERMQLPASLALQFVKEPTALRIDVDLR